MLLEARNVHAAYGELRVLHGLDFVVEKGGVTTLLGANGAGKTTTLRALARELTAEGRYAALHFSCESGEPPGDNYAGAQDAVLSEIRERARALPAELRPPR